MLSLKKGLANRFLRLMCFFYSFISIFFHLAFQKSFPAEHHRSNYSTSKCLEPYDESISIINRLMESSLEHNN